MYVRDAKNREEVWLLDQIESMGLDESAFRSRDYVIAIDEESGDKAGFGRIRIHQHDDGSDICELTSIGVVSDWRSQGVGAHVIERLVEYAADMEFETVYSLAQAPDYLATFGFEPIDDEDLPDVLIDRLADKRERHDDPVVPMRIAVDEFQMPDDLRRRFKRAGRDTRARADDEKPDTASLAEEFGIDPDEATYKYDTGGRRG